MALRLTVKETQFGIGDKVRVVQKIEEGGKSHESSFEGMVISTKGRSPGKTFMVRKIAEGGIGVERIFPVDMPSIDRVIVVKKGTEGVRRAKLYYTRTKSPTEIEMIYKRTVIRLDSGKKPQKAKAKKSPKPKTKK